MPELLSYRADSFASANPAISKANPELLTGYKVDASSGASKE